MKNREWQAIEEAAVLLQLGERASLSEIKQAYHRLSKRYHPDTVEEAARGHQSKQMYRLNAAYDLLMRYCGEYRFPLRQEEDRDAPAALYDPEEWWQTRSGESDPLWASHKSRKH